MSHQYRVRNWDTFQHYKDRSPPWVRLHRSLLDNYEYHVLPVASKAIAPLLWLLASESSDPKSGIIPGSDDQIAFRLRVATRDFQNSVKALIERGFLEVVQPDGTLLAPCCQSAVPETEADTETETKTEESTNKRKRVGLDELSLDHIADWLARKRAEGRYLDHDERFIVEYFKNYCVSKGKTYANYIAGLQGAFEWDTCQPKQHGRNGSRQQPNSVDRRLAALHRTGTGSRDGDGEQPMEHGRGGQEVIAPPEGSGE